jgi:hypothetical protein
MAFNSAEHSWELQLVNGEVNEPTLTVDNFVAIDKTLGAEGLLAAQGNKHAEKKLDALWKKVLFRWFVFKKNHREILDERQWNNLEKKLDWKGGIALGLTMFYSALSKAFVKEHTRTKELENLFNNCVPAKNLSTYARLKQEYDEETKAKKQKKPINPLSGTHNLSNSEAEMLASIKSNARQLLEEDDSSSSPIRTIEDAAMTQQISLLENQKLEKLKADLESAKKSLQSFYPIGKEQPEDAKSCDYDGIMRNHARTLIKQVEGLQNTKQEQAGLIANQWERLTQKICYLNVYKGLNEEIKRLNNDYSAKEKEDETIKKIITDRQASIKDAMERFNSFLTAGNQNNTYAEAKNILTTLQTQMVSTGRKNPTLRGSSGLNFFGFSTVTGKNNIKTLIKSIEKEEGIDPSSKKGFFSFMSS